MKIFVEVTLTAEGHKAEFHAEDYKTFEDGKIDVEAYKKCLEIARDTIDKTIPTLP